MHESILALYVWRAGSQVLKRWLLHWFNRWCTSTVLGLQASPSKELPAPHASEQRHGMARRLAWSRKLLALPVRLPRSRGPSVLSLFLVWRNTLLHFMHFRSDLRDRAKRDEMGSRPSLVRHKMSLPSKTCSRRDPVIDNLAHGTMNFLSRF